MKQTKTMAEVLRILKAHRIHTAGDLQKMQQKTGLRLTLKKQSNNFGGLK